MHTTQQHHKFIMIGTCIAGNLPVVLCKIDQFDYDIKDYHLLVQDDVNDNNHDDEDDIADDDDSDNDGQLCLLIN